MHSYNNETGILEVLEIKIFLAAQAQLKDLYRIFFKIHSVGFAIQWWSLCEFLENKKSNKSLNFSF